MTQPTYPDVYVHMSTGQDGNAFAIIGAVSKALRREVGPEAAAEFSREAMDSGSYDELLAFVQRTVNVT